METVVVIPVAEGTQNHYSKSNYDSDSKYSLICKSCFWCASYLNMNNMISKCPMCANNVDGLLDSITNFWHGTL